LFRDRADGKSVHLNTGLTREEQRRRIANYHEPFHQQLDAVMAASPGAAIVSMHSFTPVYEHQPARPMEIGVLFDRGDAQAHQIAGHLRNRGWMVALNEPYSGKDGLMYSADRHAQTHQRAAIESEIRQDVATDGSRTEGLIEDLSDAIRVVLSPGTHRRYESS
jgi:predicted N-formylglutamate amidohydrolase